MYVCCSVGLMSRTNDRSSQLEDKVSELEAKNAGNEFENENLRQLLAKLQQENMALKTSAFTFSMPMPGANQSPVGSAHGTSPDPVQQRTKVPSPPGPQPLQHRGESTSSSASAASNTVRSGSGGSVSRSPTESSVASASVSPFGNGGPRANTVFHPERYNAFASSAAPAARQLSPSAAQQMPAGFAHFGQSQAPVPAPVQNVGMSSTATASGAPNEMDWQSLLNNNFTMLAQAPEFMSFSDDAAFGNFGGYSDIWPGFSSADGGMAGIDSTLATPGNQFNTIHSKPAVPDDAIMNTIAEDNMEEFLRSLGAGQTPAVGSGDDVFDMTFSNAPTDNNDMLRSYVDSTAYKGNSGPSSSSAHSSVLSPGNFFTTSPDASSASSVPSDGKHPSASASPQASESSNNSQAFRVGTFGSRPEDALETRPTMLKRDGTVVPCSKMIEEVTSRIPVSLVICMSLSCIDPLRRSTADSISTICAITSSKRRSAPAVSDHFFLCSLATNAPSRRRPPVQGRRRRRDSYRLRCTAQYQATFTVTRHSHSPNAPAATRGG